MIDDATVTEATQQEQQDPEIKERSVVITELALLPIATLINEVALANSLGVTTRTIRRMVGRYELPPPVMFAGRSMWQTGAVLEWFRSRAERAAKEAERRAAANAKICL